MALNNTEEEIAREFKVSGTPTLVFLKPDRKVDSIFIVYMNKENFIQVLNEIMN